MHAQEHRELLKLLKLPLKLLPTIPPNEAWPSPLHALAASSADARPAHRDSCGCVPAPSGVPPSSFSASTGVVCWRRARAATTCCTLVSVRPSGPIPCSSHALSPAPPSHSPCASRTGLLSIVQMHQICSCPRTLVLAVLTARYVIHMSAQMSFQGGICKGPKVALPHPTPSLMPQCLFLTALAVENHPALFVISHLPTSGRSL